jgi:hypothetical protein
VWVSPGIGNNNAAPPLLNYHPSAAAAQAGFVVARERFARAFDGVVGMDQPMGAPLDAPPNDFPENDGGPF